MPALSSVYIVEPADQGWIIERLMRDVAAELERRGIPARIGPIDGYSGEDVIFNSRFLTALSDGRARVNSLFITHVDDRLKEAQLKSASGRFNSLVCLSEHDADFVAALTGSRQGVVGIDLPARSLEVRPTRVALFSARYEDGRKNEEWIVEYFRGASAAQRRGFVFCFMGWGWEEVCAELATLDVNYEVHRYSRFTPGEYGLYKEILPTMDTLVYLGFDGGAMSVYDALAAGVDVIAPNLSFHRGLGSSVTLFDDKAGFFREMDVLHRKHAERVEALGRRSVAAYTERLVDHWNGLLGLEKGEGAAEGAPAPVDGQALGEFRRNYKPLGPGRLRSALIRALQSALLGRSSRR